MSRIFPAICWAILGAPEVAHGEPPSARHFLVGVVPFLSTRPLIQYYRPLAEYLALELEQPVAVETAPDVLTFHERAAAGRFDLIITYAHLARLGQLDSGWWPLATYMPRLNGAIVVPSASRIKQLSDLRGQRLGLPPRPGLVTAFVLRELEDKGLRSNLTFINSAAIDAMILAMLSGESDAAVISATRVAELPESQRARVRILVTLGEVPGMILSASARLSPAETARLRQLLIAITPGTEVGRRFLTPQRYEQIEAVDAPAMKALDRYLPDARRSLEVRP